MEAHETMDACDALAVNASVARPTRHLDLNEAGLTQKALNESLEKTGQ